MPYIQRDNNRKLFFECTGCGSPIVFIHGWKAISDIYIEPVSEIGKYYRCIRYDQCGHGRSQVPDFEPDMRTLADDLNALLDEMDLNDVTLVGHSMGGLTILEYIKKYGTGRIRQIIVVDIPPKLINDEDWHYGAGAGSYTRDDFETELSLMRTNFSEYLTLRYAGKTDGWAEMTPAEKDAFKQKKMIGFDSSVLTSLYEALTEADYRDVLPSVDVPMAVFYGSNSEYCMPEAAQFYSTTAKNVKIVEFPNATHELITEYPGRFTDEVMQFCSGDTRI